MIIMLLLNRNRFLTHYPGVKYSETDINSFETVTIYQGYTKITQLRIMYVCQ